MTDPGLAAHHVRTTVRDFLAAHSEPGDAMVIAVSGGADSLSLAAACADVQTDLGLRFIPVTVDHQLQQGSAQVALTASAACAQLGLPQGRIETVEVSVDGSGLEAAARQARYSALRRVAAAEGARAILMAHTRDDQAETVLMRLARGSGSRSLAGMAEISGDVWRPLLHVARAEVAAALQHYGITPHVDAHNSDSRFLRVRVRRELLPVLTDVLGAAAVEALARSADLLRRDADALDEYASAFILTSTDEIDIAALLKMPIAVITRVIKQWLIARGAPAAALSAAHIEEVRRLASESTMVGPVTVAGGVEVKKASGRLRATKPMEA